MARNHKTHNEEDTLIVEEPDLTGISEEENIEEKVQDELNISKPEIIKVSIKKTKTKAQGLVDFLY